MSADSFNIRTIFNIRFLQTFNETVFVCVNFSFTKITFQHLYLLSLLLLCKYCMCSGYILQMSIREMNCLLLHRY